MNEDKEKLHEEAIAALIDHSRVSRRMSGYMERKEREGLSMNIPDERLETLEGMLERVGSNPNSTEEQIEEARRELQKEIVNRRIITEKILEDNMKRRAKQEEAMNSISPLEILIEEDVVEEDEVKEEAPPEEPKEGMRGLGDLVAKTIKATTGIEGCGGCKKRQAALNKWVPFHKREGKK